MVHRDQHLGHSVKAEAVGDGVFRCVGHRIAGKEGGKPLWSVSGEKAFGIGSQAQAAKAILRIGIDQ